MSTSKLDTSGVFDPQNQSEVRLTLSTQAIKFRSNGIEFLSSKSIPVWSEMTIDIQSPDAKKVRGSGVVVACEGNRQSGYVVSFIFMNLSKQAQERLGALCLA
ncbi:MAG: hypothetical protein K0Q55_4153 [Verrucomicrobia bacterium]|jgi:hypothetical protein|nr:hypothetical protein [Verrucomicrobiota bacterium]